jgi:hypothetical protein
MKRVLRITTGLLLACAVVFAVVKAIPFVRYAAEVERHARRTAEREPAALADWRREFGDPSKTLAAFPDQPNSDTAVRLVALCQEVGIEMARPKREQQQGIARESGDQGSPNREIGDYVQAELGRAGGSVTAPPETIRVFLDTHQAEISKTVSFLSTSKPPAWEMKVSLGTEAPIPNLLGHIHLQRLLVTKALNQIQLGEEKEAVLAFRASWILNESLRDRPEVIAQLVAVSIARMQVGLARKLALDPVEWRDRLGDHDYRGSLLKAMEVGSICGFRNLPIGTSRWERASRTDFLNLQRSFLVALRDSAVSDGPVGASDRIWQVNQQPLSAGQIVSLIAWPNLENAIRRVDRFILDAELTDRILEAKMLKDKLGHWPKEIAGVESSRMPGARWTYAVSEGHRMTISFNRELHWQDQKGMMLPLRYESD